MTIEDKRISKLRAYLIGVLNSLTQNAKFSLNANNLDNEPNNYSLDKIPMEKTISKWVIGTKIQRDVYSFRSRTSYSQSTMTNLKNMGFFEEFEKTIESNNKNGILPNIDNIKSIECLNCATMNYAETNTAEFDIQIQITYWEE
jgi:hypothetical protein